MALSFDGVDDVVNHGDIAAMDGASALTYGGWVRQTVLDTNTALIHKFLDNASRGTGLQILATDAKKIRGFVDPGTGNGIGDSTNTVLVANTWQHIMMVFDGAGAVNADRLKIYVDGSSVALTYIGTIPATTPSNTAVFKTQGSNDVMSIGQLYAGHIKAWTAALTAAEVRQEMHSYRPIRRANLIVWSDYNDGVRARDYSGTGNHGTVTGALTTGGPPQIPHPERFIAQKHRHGGLGLWGHRVLVK